MRLRPCFSRYPNETSWALAWCASKYIHLPEWCYEWFLHPWNVVVCYFQGHIEVGKWGDGPPCTHCVHCCKEVSHCEARSCV